MHNAEICMPLPKNAYLAGRHSYSALGAGPWLPPTYGCLLSVAADARAPRIPQAFFTIPHFDGYSAVLIRLRLVTEEALREAVTDGWLACAPPTLAAQYLNRWAQR